MKTYLKTDGATTSFTISDVEPMYHDVLSELYYLHDGDGFSKRYASETPELAEIFSHFERSAEVMVRQAAGQARVPWEDILGQLLALTQGQNVEWCLVGSAALAVRGLDVNPGDVDLVTSEQGAEALDRLLRDLRVEPLQRSEGWIWRSFGRAFLGGRLEWVGGVNDGADRPEVSDYGPIALSRLEVVRWRGVELKVPPLELQLAVNERRGRTERAGAIRRWLTAERTSPAGVLP